MVEVKQVLNKKDVKRFVCFPDALYKSGVKYYIPELKSEEYSMYSPETNFLLNTVTQSSGWHTGKGKS